MMELETQQQQSRRTRLITQLASDDWELRDAQRLRFMVFSGEMGARLESDHLGIDRDEFDAYCDHLLVRETEGGRVVGTYRILTASKAREVGGFYSQREFEMSRIVDLGLGVVELGRACVHPAYRDGGVITQLWAGLARYVFGRGYEYVVGCSSVSATGVDNLASDVYHLVSERRLSPPQWRAFPRCPFPIDRAAHDTSPSLPPLLKGYLRLGAYACGEPAWDPEFKTADLLMLLPLAEMDRRYVERLLRLAS